MLTSFCTISLGLVIEFSTLQFTCKNKLKVKQPGNEHTFSYNANDTCKSVTKQMKILALANGYNPDTFFIADLRIPSGKKRFYVYSLNMDSIYCAGLVAHGQGQTLEQDAVFSNEPGSYCSSSGNYEISVPYYGKFGLAFKLSGLENSNSNAYKRNIVLLAHECIPDKEIFPEGICQSQGCPTVSPLFLSGLNNFIRHTSKPILLHIIGK